MVEDFQDKLALTAGATGKRLVANTCRFEAVVGSGLNTTIHGLNWNYAFHPLETENYFQKILQAGNGGCVMICAASP